MLEPVFKCVVDHPQDGVLYDIQWFIGGHVISEAGSHNITYLNTSSLKTVHWAGNYSLNFNVSIGSQRINSFYPKVFNGRKLVSIFYELR